LNIAEGAADGPSIVVRLGVAGGDLDGPVEVGNRSSLVAEGLSGGPSIVKRFRIIGSGFEGEAQVIQSTMTIPPNEPSRTPKIGFSGVASLGHPIHSFVLGIRMKR
jgi:hypothetical protein